MSTRFRVFIILLGALLVVATFTYPQWQAFVASNPLQDGGEVFPGLPEEQEPAFEALSPNQREAYRVLANQNPTAALSMVLAALQPPQVVPPSEGELPELVGAVIIAEGEFTQIDPVRFANGDVTIYEAADESRLLRFTRFSVINGPELHVWLSTLPAPTETAELEVDFERIDLGLIRGTSGDQNYTEIPADLDIDIYQSIVIYSEALSLVYSYAPLRFIN